MAEEDLSLDTPKDAPETEAEEAEGSGGSKKIIIIAAAAVLLIGGGAAAFFMLSGDSEEAADAEITEVTDAAPKAVPEPPKGDAIYVSVPNPFLMNITSGKKQRMMQINVKFMVRSKEAEDALKLHMPLIRNDMLDYFSLADAEVVKTKEGRDALKKGALATAQKVIKEQAGFEAIELILFTGFVIQ